MLVDSSARQTLMQSKVFLNAGSRSVQGGEPVQGGTEAGRIGVGSQQGNEGAEQRRDNRRITGPRQTESGNGGTRETG